MRAKPAASANRTCLSELGCRDREAIISADAASGKGGEDGGRNECGEHFGGMCTKSGWRADSSQLIDPERGARRGERASRGRLRCGKSVRWPPSSDPTARQLLPSWDRLTNFKLRHIARLGKAPGAHDARVRIY